MFRSGLFRRHYAISVISVIGFILLGLAFSGLVTKYFMGKMNRPEPAIFFAHLIDTLSPQDPVNGLKKIELISGNSDMPFNFAILDENGNNLYGTVGNIPKINLPYIAIGIYQANEIHQPSGTPQGVIRLNQKTPRYLYFKFSEANKPPGATIFFTITFILLFAMVLAGIAFALNLIFRSLNEHVNIADAVISELQSGNLKARFPVHKKDELGKAKERFNKMAEEIEILVERLRNMEQSRNLMLQDLTHDLRTPVASLKNILETIFTNAKLDPKFSELSEIATNEVEYIGSLVEDLLLLAMVSEPKYHPQQSSVDIVSILEEEALSIEQRQTNSSIQLLKDIKVEQKIVLGDEHLLRRMIRNSLENAFSFAKTKVKISIFSKENIMLTIEDDGPGLTQDAIDTFGERRHQRKFGAGKSGRLSLGLGSVIMKTVATVHRGKIIASNKSILGGAKIEIILEK